MKLLNSHSCDRPSTEREAFDRREQYYKTLVQDFISSNAQALFRSCSEDDVQRRYTQLLETFRATGEVTCKLWTQKVWITTTGRKELLHKRFFTKSTDAEAHAAHASKLDAEGTSFDGMPIQLVVEPGIVAWGNERGNHYDEKKVWLKAVVWISSGTLEADKTPKMEIGEAEQRPSLG